MSHDTRYALLIVPKDSRIALSDAILPGVMLHSRTTVTRAVWALKLRRGLARISGLASLALKAALRR